MATTVILFTALVLTAGCAGFAYSNNHPRHSQDDLMYGETTGAPKPTIYDDRLLR